MSETGKRFKFGKWVIGDLFCTCHNNHRGNQPYAYFWRSEFEHSVAAPQPAPQPLPVGSRCPTCKQEILPKEHVIWTRGAEPAEPASAAPPTNREISSHGCATGETPSPEHGPSKPEVAGSIPASPAIYPIGETQQGMKLLASSSSERTSAPQISHDRARQLLWAGTEKHYVELCQYVEQQRGSAAAECLEALRDCVSLLKMLEFNGQKCPQLARAEAVIKDYEGKQ